MAFQETYSGLVNTDWQSTPPPSASRSSARRSPLREQPRRNALHVIWGRRAPTLAAPLLRGSYLGEPRRRRQRRHELSQYQGREQVTVPAFPSR